MFLNPSDKSARCSTTFKISLTSLMIRLFLSVFVKTYFDPDEYWQSLEVAHNIVFGYGYMTWEWQPYARLRSFAHPALFAVVFKAGAILGIDSPQFIRLSPRIVQACIAMVGDVFLYKLAKKWFGPVAAEFSLFCQLSNWFYCYCIVRTYSNSLETVLLTVSLFYWPEPSLGEKCSSTPSRKLALFVAAICVIFRPTSVCYFLVLGLRTLLCCQDKYILLFKEVLPIGVTVFGLSLLLDRIFYGVWTITMLNFFAFNAGNVCDGAAMYGTHSFHWYITQGLPTMLGVHAPLFLFGLYYSYRYLPVGLIALLVLIMSSNRHKEFRFILPILPICFLYCGYGLATLQAGLKKKKARPGFFPSVIIVSLLTNLILIVYFSHWHQRAPVQIMEFISDKLQANTTDYPRIQSIDFLTGCHSTPFYSHIHRDIPMRILGCQPVFSGNVCIKNQSSIESEKFHANPVQFVEKYYSDPNLLPSNIVIFDDDQVSLQNFFFRENFTLQKSFAYLSFGKAKKMLLYGREKLNK